MRSTENAPYRSELYDWGTNYPDVINVGAWDKDANGNLLISSEETFGTVDILADGQNLDGGLLGLHLPEAEITNEINDALIAFPLGQRRYPSTRIRYSDLINSIIQRNWPSVSFTINDGGVTSQHVEVVLTDDLSWNQLL